MRTFPFVLLFLLTLCFVGCRQRTEKFDQGVSAPSTENPPIAEITSEPIRRAIESASEQTKTTTGYTQQYFDIPYPNGDLPEDTGACTDVIVRAFRNAGVDLQKEVHEDMARNFSDYPRKWGLSKTDTNIDHRRVPNLQTYFQRKGKSLPIRSIGDDYQPGDVVSWDLDGKGMTHIGIVSNLWNETTKRYLIIHNIGAGAKAEDRLFEWKITGHYRYF
ncbi:MAG TPA: DUF1287 domain-containing protein [Pyrinomonadaceae bacterium]|nr:DUF1287 domain-containing protein [Pyrinomonadaceae bacterium]